LRALRRKMSGSKQEGNLNSKHAVKGSWQNCTDFIRRRRFGNCKNVSVRKRKRGASHTGGKRTGIFEVHLAVQRKKDDNALEKKRESENTREEKGGRWGHDANTLLKAADLST